MILCVCVCEHVFSVDLGRIATESSATRESRAKAIAANEEDTGLVAVAILSCHHRLTFEASPNRIYENSDGYGDGECAVETGARMGNGATDDDGTFVKTKIKILL